LGKKVDLNLFNYKIRGKMLTVTSQERTKSKSALAHLKKEYDFIAHFKMLKSYGKRRSRFAPKSRPVHNLGLTFL
jgi:hypothetical protein